MSNLGIYQIITTVSKKIGGPGIFIALVAGSGYLVLRGVEFGTKKVVKHFQKMNQDKDNLLVISNNGKSNEGILFQDGDQIRVIEKDKNVLLIEKIGDTNSPYYVSEKFMESISTYNHGGK